MVIRSVLWVGSAKDLAASGLPESAGYDVVWERELDAATGRSLAAFDAAVVDTPEAAARLARLRPDLPVLVHGGAARAGTSVRGWLAHASPSEPPPLDGLVGDGAAMDEVRRLAVRAARSDASVLISGETGTGKELVARAIHAQSARRGPFVAVNCAAFPDTLLESELLGHERGAFSGADRDRRGLVEESSGGTLFLDEVAETSPAFQAKLLRVLQERMVRPLGANRERAVDLRVVSATHRRLDRAVAQGRFREDLFYRLAVFPLTVPPLRERGDDLLPLVRHFIHRHSRPGAPHSDLAPDAVPLLRAHRWPGNVRELENEVQRALALADPGEPLRPEHFSERLRAALAPLREALPDELPDEPLRATVARLEAHLIRRALARHDGRRSETARQLGLTREGLYKKMKRLGVE
ncbi:MAG: sigma-54 interaction domain-containing protein [Myxococcota bacterium]